MLNTPCSEVVWRVLATHFIRQFPLHLPSIASPCAITFQLYSIHDVKICIGISYSRLVASGDPFRYPCHGSGGYTPSSPPWRSDLIPDLVVRVFFFFLAENGPPRFFSEYFGFPRSFSSQQCCKILRISPMHFNLSMWSLYNTTTVLR